MTAAIAAGRRYLPRGYADFARQVLIWFGFLAAYQVARGVADRDPTRAFANGWKVIDWEQRLAGLGELTLQGWTQSSHFLAELVSWTYWNSEFTVIGIALLWVYLRRNPAFTRFRNTILLANVLGLIGYVLLPTAPPRFFTSIGFEDTLGQFGGLNHGSGLVELASNPYAAMPSLHAADALIVGVILATVVRRPVWKALWLLWPLWVWFAVMATGNHFWLDVLAGIVLAAVTLVLVFFENRDQLLFYWVGAAVFVIGSVLDILDGALARAGGKTTPFGAFLDSTTDRISEGFMLTAIAFVFARHGRDVFVAVAMAAVAGSFLVSYTRARAEALGLRGDVGIGSRAERVVVITAGLVLAPWGVLPWAIALLAVTAWVTVVQRILHVRHQLLEGSK